MNIDLPLQDSAPKESKTFFTRKRVTWGLPVLVLLLVAASVGGYFIWLEMSYQTEEAQAVVDRAMENLNTAHQEADKVIKRLENIEDTSDVTLRENKFATREDVANIQKEITSAKAALAIVTNEITSYESKLETAELFKLKDEYRTYLSMRRESSEEMHSFINHSNNSFSFLEQLCNLYTASIDLDDRYKNFTYSIDPAALQNQVVQLKADIQSIINLEDQLINGGVLKKEIKEVNQFYIGCMDRIIIISNAYAAWDYGAFDNAMNDYNANCSEAALNDKEAKKNSLWDESWNAFYKEVIRVARDKNGSSQNSRGNTDEYFQYNV